MLILSLKEIKDYYFDRLFRKMPKIASIEETVEIAKKKSICRYGDADFFLMYSSQDLKYQKYSPILAQKLREVIQSTNDDFHVCLPDMYESLGKFKKSPRSFWLKVTKRYRKKTSAMLSLDTKYGNSFLSRPYMIYKDKSPCKHQFDLIKEIWENKDLVIVEGEFSRLGVGNDLFDNTKSIERVLTKCEDAFDMYNDIVEFCKTLSKDKLIILALGPTATVMSFDLSQLGYHALDMGHVDLEYEWFLQEATEPVPIENKSNNEAGSNYASASNNEKYLSQIIKKIGV